MNGNKPTLGIDLEGVLSDSVERWLEIAKSEHGAAVQKEEIRGHLLDHDAFKHIGESEYLDMFKRLWDAHESIRLVDNEAPSVLNRLKDRYSISIITATVGGKESAEKWLNGKGIPHDKIVIVPRLGSKMQPDTDIHIDDFFDVLKDARVHGKGAIMFLQPWNAKHLRSAAAFGVHTAKNWNEIEQLLLSGPLSGKY